MLNDLNYVKNTFINNFFFVNRFNCFRESFPTQIIHSVDIENSAIQFQVKFLGKETNDYKRVKSVLNTVV